MKTKFKFLSILLIFACCKSYAQDKYSAAKLILKNGDTTSVFISNLTSSIEISVKKSLREKPKIVLPKDIIGYIYKNNTYLSKFIGIREYTINKSLSDFAFVNNGQFLEIKEDIKPYKDTVFVQALVTGKINLYEFIPQDNFTTYYVEKNNKVFELPPRHFEFHKDTARGFGYFYQNGVYNKIPNFSGRYVENNSYLDTLNMLTSESEYFSTIKPMVIYERKELINYIFNYNLKFSDSQPKKIYSSESMGKIYFGVNFGKTLPLYDFEYPITSQLTGTKSKAFSIYALLPAYKKNRNLFYKFGYSTFNYSLQLKNNINSQIYDRKLSVVSLGLRYSSQIGIVRPFWGGSLTITKIETETDSEKRYPINLEFGTYIKIGPTNLVISGYYTPIFKKANGFQIFSYSIGVLF